MRGVPTPGRCQKIEAPQKSWKVILCMGFSKSAEYRAWSSMKQRCLNPRCSVYKNYGGRGITVCVRWQRDFLDFLDDLGPRPSPKHTLDRIDNDGNYQPGNVRWATYQEQESNRRNNRWVEWNGARYTVSDLARLHNLSPTILWGRLFMYKLPINIALQDKIPHWRNRRKKFLTT